MALLMFDKNNTPVHSGMVAPVVNFLTVRVIVFNPSLSAFAICLFSASASLSVPRSSSDLSPLTTFKILYSFPNTGC